MATKIEVVTPGYIGRRVLATDGTYLYGVSSTNNKIYKYSASDYSTDENGYDFGSGIVDRIFGSSVTNRLFVLIKDTSSKHTLYRSTDGGVTFAFVCLIGYNSIDGHFKLVSILNKGFLEYDENTYFVAEYNVYYDATFPQVDGGAFDTVRVLKSTDGGVSFTPIVTWNTNGTNQLRHLHYIVADPDTPGHIYVGTGDEDAKSGIIQWDSNVGIWQDNKTLAQIHLLNGFKVLVGAGTDMKYKGLDLLFSGNYFINFADEALAAQGAGIWRCTKDMNPANYELVDNQAWDYAGRAGWTGLKTSKGNFFTFDQVGTSSLDRQINIYSGSHDLVEWKIVGKYGVIPGTVAYITLTELNGKIYLSEAGGGSSGKGPGGTTIIEELGEYQEDDATIVAPTYYVSTTGADNTTNGRGWYSNLSWLTLGYALQASKITYGARVIIADGTYPISSALSATINANAKPGTGKVWITGQGTDNTVLSAVSGTAYPITLGSIADGEEYVLSRLKAINVGTVTGALLRVGSTSMPNSKVYLRNVVIGDPSIDTGSDIIKNYGTIDIDKSLVNGYTGATKTAYTITSNHDDAVITINRAEVLGGISSVYSSTFTGVDITVTNSLLKGFSARGIRFDVGIPIVKNNIIYGAVGALSGLHNAGTAGGTDTEIDGNCFYNCGSNTVNVTNNGGSHSITADPLFINESGGNYHLQVSSPCNSGGVVIAGVHDIAGVLAEDANGNKVHFQPNIGPYDDKGDTKTITSDYSPTGYGIRDGATVALGAHGLSVSFAGLTLNENNIRVKEAGIYRVHSFTRKAGTTQYVYGEGGGGSSGSYGSGGGIFGSNFS